MVSLRRVGSLALLLASGAGATFACVGDDADRVAGAGDDAGADGPSGAVALAIEVAPAQLEGLAGSEVKAHVAVRPGTPVSGPIRVVVAASPVDGGASPLAIETAQRELAPELPESDLTVKIDGAARHGFYPVTIVASGTTADGRTLRGETKVDVRVVGAPGRLDTGFADGKGFFELCPFPEGTQCQPGDVWAYPDGRLLVTGSGYEDSTGDQFFATRRLPDGAPDPTFGSGGTTTARVGRIFSYARSEIAALADGTFVVAFTAASNLTFLHLLEDGRIDPSWGDDGGVEANISSGTSATGRLAPTATGFVLGGTLHLPPEAYAGAVQRRLASGALDPSFGDGGTTTFFVDKRTSVDAVAVDPDGRIVVGGEEWVPDAPYAFLVALSPSGTPTALGHGCMSPNAPSACVIADHAGSSSDAVRGIRRHRGGYLVAAHHAGPPLTRSTTTISHYSAAGSGDRFGEVDFDTGAAIPADPAAMITQPDDAFIVANGFYGDGDIHIARYDGDGELDLAFGDGGLAEPFRGVARRMTLVEDGRQLVVIAYDSGSTPRKVRLARYWLR